MDMELIYYQYSGKLSADILSSTWHSAILNDDFYAIRSMKFGSPKNWRANCDKCIDNLLFTSLIVSMFKNDENMIVPTWLVVIGELMLSDTQIKTIKTFIVYVSQVHGWNVSLQFIWLLNHCEYRLKLKTKRILYKYMCPDLCNEIIKYT